jgi:hypothetical protein
LNDESEGEEDEDEHNGSFEIRRDELESIQSIYPEGVIIYEPVEEEKLGDYNVIIRPSITPEQKEH